ncbi:MAG: paraquat-inducible protein A [Gammaproteobacteria bacterium]|nr:paraquat-inducible protein A [Gammaproteobacteria bacterium]
MSTSISTATSTRTRKASGSTTPEDSAARRVDETGADLACPGCDLLVNVAGLHDGESAACPRCGHTLTRYRADASSRTLAFTVAALILLVIANSFSFLSFSAGGLENQMTLGQTPGTLFEYGMPSAAFIVGAFIIFIPAGVLVMMVGLCIPLLQQRYYPWLRTLAKGIFLAQNWAMVEVFIIGVIVALVKIAAMATVYLGVSFWAYVAFAICFTLAVASLDRYQCWQQIEALESMQ